MQFRRITCNRDRLKLNLHFRLMTTMSLRDVQVLVTGGAGFIGSNLVDRLMEEGAFVRVIDNFSSGMRYNIQQWIGNERFQLIEGDIRDQALVNNAVCGVSLVFHQAAIVSVPLSVEDPRLVTDVNVMGTLNLLDASRRAGVERIVVTSSAAVYGDQEKMPISETAETKPLSPYGASKLAAEEMALSFNRTYGLSTTILRPFNIYGPRQRGSAYAGVITVFLQSAFSNRPLIIEGDGKQTRDFVFVDDVVECNIRAARITKADGRVYNIGSGNRIAIEELARLIIEVTASQSDIVHGSPREGDIRDSQASIERASSELDYRPRVSMREGLRKTAEWIRNNID